MSPAANAISEPRSRGAVAEPLRAGTATLPVTVLIGTKNEGANIARCLGSLTPAAEVIVVDSRSVDATPAIARGAGARVVDFDYAGGYPKKRQWALDSLEIATPWILLIDADEVVPDALWREIAEAVGRNEGPSAYLITKGFHFLGRRFRFGGFSFGAVLLIRPGKARFEQVAEGACGGLDMEIHERVIVDGPVGRLSTPLIHEDFKGLAAYLDRHNRYSTWEAKLRRLALASGTYGESTIAPRLFGNAQERRRFLKQFAMRVPCEPALWFVYHYFIRLGFLEGRRGLIASRIRAGYIRDVRSKLYELRLDESNTLRKPR